MTRQQNIDTIKGMIRRHRRWGGLPNHRRMMCRMISRARGHRPDGNDSALLPFWPDMAAIQPQTSGKAAE